MVLKKKPFKNSDGARFVMHKMRISTNYVSLVVLRLKNLEIKNIVKTNGKNPKQCQKMKPNPSKDQNK
jgi:hypothetical protein